MPITKCPKCGFGNPAELRACGRCQGALPSVSIQDDGGSAAVAQNDQGVSFRRGQIIANRYTVIDLIGRGGMGCIYRVHDNTLDEEVALKTLLPQFVRDKLVVERFYNEARIARQLSHTNIVRVHDIGFAGNTLYISMEYLRGRSLRSLMDDLPTGQRLPIRTTLKIMDELCAALEYAHRYTVHRDIKPENVMIGNDGTVKLMDFGISKLMTHNQLTAVSMVMGTPYYMSPEQLKDSSSVDARADIYSVGVMLYEMLTGNLPTGIIKPASQTISDVPATLDPIVARCVEPEPRNRFASVQELRDALRTIHAWVDPDLKGFSPAPVHASGDSSLRRIVGGALAALLLAGTAIGVWQLELRRANAVASPPPVAVPAPVEPVDDVYPALARFVENVREEAETAATENDAASRIFALFDEYWSSAQRRREAQDPEAVQDAWRAAQCLAGLVGPPSGMVFIPPGPVVYVNGTEEWLDGFFIDRNEVTNAEFGAFCESRQWPMPPYQTAVDAAGQSLYAILSPPDVPATMISFFDAQAYAAANVKTLPTLAQWIRATIRLDDTYSSFPWGDAPDSDGANVAGNGGETTHYGPTPPGTFPRDATGYGCLDMAGNVREWTRSIAPADQDIPSAVVNPGDEAASLLQQNVVSLGGSYAFPPASIDTPTPVSTRLRDGTLGFRCVREIPRDLNDLQALLAER